LRTTKNELFTPKTRLRTPKTQLLTNKNALRTPKNELLNPKTQLRTPKNELLNPKTQLRTPKTQLLTNKNALRTPKNELLNPKNALRTPKTSLRTPKTTLIKNLLQVGQATPCIWINPLNLIPSQGQKTKKTNGTSPRTHPVALRHMPQTALCPPQAKFAARAFKPIPRPRTMEPRHFDLTINLCN
jgi:hypothetical protein